MNVKVVGKNIKVTDAIRSDVEKKLSRMDKYFSDAGKVECRVVVRSYKVGAKVEVTIFTKEMTFRTEVVNQDLYAAVDLAVDKLEGQMRKLKTRISRTKEGDSLGRALMMENIVAEQEDEEAEEVVRTKTMHLEPMTLDEAITRMEAVGHTFYLYLDSDDDQVAVAYKRLDGGYGVIEADNRLA